MTKNEITIASFNDLFLYLNNIEESDSFFLLHYYCDYKLDFEEMLYALSTTNDIIGIIKLFIIKKYLKEL